MDIAVVLTCADRAANSDLSLQTENIQQADLAVNRMYEKTPYLHPSEGCQLEKHMLLCVKEGYSQS